ncbi:MAG: branched-chain amino acid ABC transporter permease [Eubacteriales bacterium]
MYINFEHIVQIGAVVATLSTIVGAIVAIYKTVERDKRQSLEIKSIKEEQTLICYGILCCLKGLKEQGCNGPVTEAQSKLEKHLNKTAHETM